MAKLLTIEYDRDYGISRRTGWSIAWRGHYVVQLERWLPVAIVKAIVSLWRNS